MRFNLFHTGKENLCQFALSALFLFFSRLWMFCFALIFLLFLPFELFSQETTAVGRVLDKQNGMPLSAVNVYFKNTTIGTTSNEEGYFLLRSWNEERTLIFSSIGYKTKEIRLKPRHPQYFDILLEEENTLLEDILVLPGTNPALEWMKMIRIARRENDVTQYPDYRARSTQQNLIFLNGIEKGRANRRIFEQLQKGSLTQADSSLLVPLYMSESVFELTKGSKIELSKNIFSTPQVADNLVMQLSDAMSSQLNFYNNTLIVLGKSIISPLASAGNAYYNYYLVDSLETQGRRQYEIRFRSKNPKNLALNGVFYFDSASLALTRIEAELSPKANINYIERLLIEQEFDTLPNNRWKLQSERLTLDMTYSLMPDSTRRSTRILFRQTASFNLMDSASCFINNFAETHYSIASLESKMQELDDTQFLRTAKWIASTALTGHVRIGILDLGHLQQTVRLTDLEGLRLNLPLKTNEHLWKNAAVGGYVGYGFRNGEVKYSLSAGLRLPAAKSHILTLQYTDDYRRVDYNYNNYTAREDAWSMDDEDVISTVFSFISGSRLSPRKEWTLAYAYDWSPNLEIKANLRINKIFAYPTMPLSRDGERMLFFGQQSLTGVMRLSFGERKYNYHLQRIYVKNEKPILWTTLEAGRYGVAHKTGYYGKMMVDMKQNLRFSLCQWNYMIQMGCVIGRVPYPFLEIAQGNAPSGVNFYRLNKINYLEFAHDRYVQFHNEFLFNGILLNHVPLVKHLNLREIVQLKFLVGDLSHRHRQVLDFPPAELGYLSKIRNPYIEANVGVTNLLRIFTIQLNYRLTNHHPQLSPWGINTAIRLDF